MERASNRLSLRLREFSEKCIFVDGINTSNTPLLENTAMVNNILDAHTFLLPRHTPLALEADRLVYVFNHFVIG